MPRRRQSSLSRWERRFQLSSVWPVCYSTVLLLTHAYLLYQATGRTLVYRVVLPGSVNYLIPLLVLSALLLPAIVLLSLLRLGTYTNDAVQVGYGLLKKEIDDKDGFWRKRCHLGAPPIAIILHVTCAYLLLIGNVFTVAEGRRQNIYTNSPGSTIFLLDWGTLHINSTNVHTDGVTVPSTSLELVNLIIALVVYSYRVVSVFWQTSRLFTLVYWLQAMAAILLHTLSYLGFKTLYTEMVTAQNPTIFLLDKYVLLTLYILSNAVLFISSWCMFHFGYGVILETIRKFLKHLGHHQEMESDFGTYLPHGIALGSILFYVGCNAPIMYDYVSLYSDTHDKLLIAHLIACVLYMLLWIIIWFSFTVKQTWNFKIHEINLKRYAILQNRAKYFVDGENNAANDDERSCHSNEFQAADIRLQETFASSEDNISNSTTSTNNGGASRSTNGILSHKLNSRLKRKYPEQKVKFQEATKIVIETNLDSDLDTIPESDHTECADSAMFSGSGGSNDSNDSPTAPQNQLNFNKKPPKPNYKDLILNPNNIQLLATSQQESRLWSSTGDLEIKKRRQLAEEAKLPKQQTPVNSDSYSTNYVTAPYTPRNLAHNNNYVSDGHERLFDDPGMSSAV